MISVLEDKILVKNNNEYLYYQYKIWKIGD